MGRYTNRPSLSDNTVSVIRSDYTAEVNETILIDSSDGSFTINLPYSDTVGDSLQIIDVGAKLKDYPVKLHQPNSQPQFNPMNDTSGMNYSTIFLDIPGSITTLIVYQAPGAFGGLGALYWAISG